MSYDIIALPPEKDPHVWVALTNSIKKEDSPPHFLCREQLCVCTMYIVYTYTHTVKGPIV